MPDAPPLVSITFCGDSVCMSKDDALAFAGWVGQVVEVETALAGCSLVERVP